MDPLQYWAQVFQSGSIILAAIVAIFGIDAWRREYVGKRRMELAEEVLALFYQVRDVIRAMRSPVGFSGEGESRKAETDESPERKKALDNAFVIIERYNKHADLFSRLHAMRYRFMAQIGKKESEPFDELDQVLNQIFLAARRLAREWSREERCFTSDADREAFHKKLRESEAIFWSGEDPDVIEQSIEALTLRMEATCKGILTSRSTLYRLINFPLWK